MQKRTQTAPSNKKEKNDKKPLSTNKKKKKNSITNQELKASFETLVKHKEDQEKLIKSQENTIQYLKKNEQHLLDELQKQGDIARDALNKLYQFQQDYNIERDKLKKYYEDYFRSKESEIISKYESLIQESNVTTNDYQKKMKDFISKEQLYLEEIELLKKKKLFTPREKDLQVQLDDMETKLSKVHLNQQQLKLLQSENQQLLLKINQYERQLTKRKDQEQKLKEAFSQQVQELQREVKYWKGEMDKVIRENNVVISKLNRY